MPQTVISLGRLIKYKIVLLVILLFSDIINQRND